MYPKFLMILEVQIYLKSATFSESVKSTSEWVECLAPFSTDENLSVDWRLCLPPEVTFSLGLVPSCNCSFENGWTDILLAWQVQLIVRIFFKLSSVSNSDCQIPWKGLYQFYLMGWPSINPTKLYIPLFKIWMQNSKMVLESSKTEFTIWTQVFEPAWCQWSHD